MHHFFQYNIRFPNGQRKNDGKLILSVTDSVDGQIPTDTVG